MAIYYRFQKVKGQKVTLYQVPLGLLLIHGIDELK